MLDLSKAKALSLEYTAEMEELCRPLKENNGVGITLFNRIYWNGYQFSLCSHKEFLTFFYEERLAYYTQFNDGFVIIQSGPETIYNIEEIVDKESEYYLSYTKLLDEKFDCRNSLIIILQGVGYLDVLSFSFQKIQKLYQKDIKAVSNKLSCFATAFEKEMYKALKEADEQILRLEPHPFIAMSDEATPVCLDLCQQVADWAKDFKEEHHLNYFCYTRAYWTGKAVVIMDYEAWGKYFINKQLHNNIHGFPSPLYKSEFFFDEIDKTLDFYRNVLLPAQLLYDCHYGYVKSAMHLGYGDLFTISGPKDGGDIKQRVIKNKKVFHKFFADFLSENAQLVQDAIAKTEFKYSYGQLLGIDTRGPQHSMTDMHCNRDVSSSPEKVLEVLTKRELSIMEYVAKHMTAKQIAEQLSLSPRTIENNISRIKDKLLCNKITELTKIAESLGF